MMSHSGRNYLARGILSLTLIDELSHQQNHPGHGNLDFPDIHGDVLLTQISRSTHNDI
jgi:hypothetical protein